LKKIILLIFFVLIVLVGITVYRLKYTDDLIYDEDIIVVPISVHLVNDSSYHYTTDRDFNDIMRVFTEANRIWEQGQIEFIIEDIDTIEIDSNEFSSVFLGNVRILMEREDFDNLMINGFLFQKRNLSTTD